ncbi:Uncharacterized protein Adt_24726 [Abeliophyllum distichum]|uniref:Uncharacterized protein n=1 Tax=Abeliophyllum distichum TaxID=126358 RepID=A0ABD1SEL4_9LAMI
MPSVDVSKYSHSPVHEAIILKDYAGKDYAGLRRIILLMLFPTVTLALLFVRLAEDDRYMFDVLIMICSCAEAVIITIMPLFNTRKKWSEAMWGCPSAMHLAALWGFDLNELENKSSFKDQYVFASVTANI